MKRIIVVTHQIPWTYKEEKQEITLSLRRGHTAQFSGSYSLKSEFELVYIGWSRESWSKEAKQLLWEKERGIVVEMDLNIGLGHYEGYCKTELWPMFHYILWDNATDGTVEKKKWDCYKKANQIFCEVISRVYEEGDQKRTEILSGLLGSNLIGFQTYSHARHFISSCTRVIGCESTPSGVEYHGFFVSIGIFPIGIDLERLQRFRSNPLVHEKVQQIKKLYEGKKIIFSRDTMDHIKGIAHKMESFEKFLEMYPEWHNKVALVQVSTSKQKENPQIVSRVSKVVARINGIYGSLESVPVHHYHHNLDPEEYFALMSIADVALITPLRDGMNTTCHDFVICQQENKGVLILSEFAGTAGAMAGAILVNPWDFPGVANVINEALSKTFEERSVKHKHLYDYVTSHTAEIWAKSFIKELQVKSSIPDQVNPTPWLDFDKVKKSYDKGKKRLLLFDYDGTLTPIVKIPKDAVPPPRMLEALEKLVADENNVIFIISGRDQECLDDWLGHIPGLGLSAEHGSFIKYPGGKWINLAAELDLEWKNEVIDIFNHYTDRTPGSFIEHKRCSITWHYRLADPTFGTFQAKECENVLINNIASKLPVEVMVGKKNLEVRPISMNKGEIVKRLVQSRQPDCDFAICAGDDRTDEDMFKALAKSGLNPEDVYTCTLGSATKLTRADYYVSAPSDIITLLCKLAFE